MEHEYLSREPRQYTKWERFKNWVYYNKWWVIAAAVLLYIVISIIIHIGNVVTPDYRFAYVGSTPLPESAVSSFQEAIESLGKDLNGDGQIKVELRQYVFPEDSLDPTYGNASLIALTADFTSGESYFFLLEDPEAFHKQYQVLANLDGSLPAEDDLSSNGKVLRWDACPTLSSLPLGEYSAEVLGEKITGDCQSIFSTLYLGRRYFYSQKSAADQEGCTALWDILTEDAVS